MTAQVFGVRETMNELRKVDRATYTASVNGAKRAAEPLRSAVAASIPEGPPLSGFAHNGRTGWGKRGARSVTTKYGGRAKRDRESWPLLRVALTGAAASIWDMAGRGSSGATASGAALISSLGGSPSRGAWPAAERVLPTIQADVAAAVQLMEREASARLSKGA